MNNAIFMNKRPLSEAELEKALAERLREILRSVPWLGDWRVESNPAGFDRAFDLLATGKVRRGAEVELWVDCRLDPRPAMFPYVDIGREFENKSVKRIRVPVFAAPFISPRMAEICESHGWSWFDLAGNYRIDMPGLLHLQHTGEGPVHKRPRPSANLGTAEAARVVRALLLPENAGMRWTQRRLAEHFGELENPIPEPSLGLVNKVVRHLRDEAFIEGADGGFRLRDPLKLLFAWRDVYRFDRHERRGYFTLLQGKGLRDALAKLGSRTGGLALYASFSAAEFQAPHVRQAKTWLYVRQQDIAKLEELVAAKPVESGENLVVLIPDDDGVFYLGDGGRMSEHRLACTNEVQTYVDLWHSGGRGREAAEALLEQRLRPEWKARGVKL